VDDGSSTVALPEVPLLGVLPGTGGLTRVVDKRKVRRDLADAFSTLAEGVKGKRAVEWGLVDAVVPRSKFADTIAQRARELAAKAPSVPRSAPVKLDPIGEYRHVALTIDDKERTAELTVRGPAGAKRVEDASFWPLRMARELDHALLRLRFEHENVGLVIVRTEGDRKIAHEVGELLTAEDGFIREVRLNLARTLRRMDVTARSFFAVVDQRSCFSGPLFELLLACDRSYVLDADGVEVWPGSLSAGALPGWNGISRLETRFLGDPQRAQKIVAAGKERPIEAATTNKLGLATVFADEIDFEEELRVAVEERASLSPDALTGMEQNYRFTGPETLATKIFGRLSAWQNWIFIRPNATGERGALTMYGKPERPQFDYRRT
jgi:benzoyl-CoA-dihydrodiol lyase